MDLEEIKNKIKKEKEIALEKINKIKNENELIEFKASHLGKKSLLTDLFANMKNVSNDLKKDVGFLTTSLREFLTDLCAKKEKDINEEKINKTLEEEKIDITLPGYNNKLGSKHPFFIVIDEVVSFFKGLGYSIASGPEVELELYNFEKVNIPKGHPSRDMQDSFSIDVDTVLRSHTSSVQARVMEKAGGIGPIKIICPGKVYRRDNDATHSHQFGQIEGLVVSKDITFASLLETLTLLLKYLFGENKNVRFRPSFFPFTEPSVETDVECFECHGKGCSLCKNTGYIEILGAGMVHPNVLRINGFDDKKYKGFAFGLGIDRIAMMKYGIDDIKRFYLNDISFLRQFSKE